MKHSRIAYPLGVALLATGCATHRSDGGVCTPNLALRCEDAVLVRCDDAGTAELSETCPLGCNGDGPRCFDPIPSNGLARYLELASKRDDLNLGQAATINTDTGEVLVGGGTVVVDTDTVAQPGAPTIRVMIVRSLTAQNVVVTGTNALAIVSGGDIKIDGTFSISATGRTPGSGSFSEPACLGQPPPPDNIGGAGGGGFGSEGGAGGTKSGDLGMPGQGGKRVGTETLTPLRGGCEGGFSAGRTSGAGGGAIQLVSRSQIAVAGVLAASGGGALGGGGSGGGILLEAPNVRVSGKVVANGGGGGGRDPGLDGRSDRMPTGGAGRLGIVRGEIPAARGGNGAAWDSPAEPGGSRIGIVQTGSAGCGGGGFGRIRVNTAPGGLLTTGAFSPNPSLGNLTKPQ